MGSYMLHPGCMCPIHPRMVHAAGPRIAETAVNGPPRPAAAPLRPSLPSADFDPTNTTLFIGGLSGGVSEEQLRASFARFGDIIYVKIPAVRGVWWLGWLCVSG
jgi:hypothetical protein